MPMSQPSFKNTLSTGDRSTLALALFLAQLEHDAARSDRDLGSIAWFVVLACYKLGIILEGTHARACAGQAPRETGDKLHAHTIALFERALRRIG